MPFGRDIIEAHLDMCLDAGLNVEGIKRRGGCGPMGVSDFLRREPRRPATRSGSLGI